MTHGILLRNGRSAGLRRMLSIAAIATIVLAACGSSDDDTSSTSATQPTTDATSPPTEATQPSTDATSAPGTASNLLDLACISPDNLGGDLTIPVGINVALSGQGAYYGDVMSSAAKLAAEQIKAAGGPDFQLSIKDHKSGDAAAGVATTREFGDEGIHLALYSYIGVLGSAFDGIEQYKILSLDGGGGTQEFGQGKPFFYGTRSQPPNDGFVGIAKYLAEKFPDVKQVAFVIGDTGAENVKNSTEIVTSELGKIGVSIVDTEVVTFGGTDFATAITKILSSPAELIVAAQYGTDPGYFLKQLRGAGSDLQVIGSDLVPDVLDIAGPEASAGYIWAQQYFNPESPGNDWGTFFVDSWTDAYPDKEAPDFYAANYYQDMFTLWQTVQRVLSTGGDPTDPDALLEAFTSDLTFPSVAGAPQPDKPCGSYSIDPATHTLSSVSMGVVEVQPDGVTVKQVASFDIGGADFKLLD